MKCETCKFCHVRQNDKWAYIGNCRRYPPKPSNESMVSWPEILPDEHWCGEWQSKEDK